MCLLNFWLNNKQLWFNCSDTDDKHVSDLFEKHIEDDAKMLMSEEKVLLYDQFARHYYRGEQANHINMYFSVKAIEITEQKIPINLFDKYPNTLWVWMMMPYRHRGHTDDILKVIALCWLKVNNVNIRNNYTDYHCIKRFLRASYMSLTHNINIEKQDAFSFQKEQLKYQNYKHILDNSFILPTLSSIDHPIYKSIKKNITQYIPDHATKKVLLMLSGGVDSMVCMHVLSQIPNFNFQIFHINYKNRGEDSDDEEYFIKSWCMYHGIHLYVKTFPEIQRKECMDHGLRDLYETYTKNAKMDFIKGFDYVILGHNKDDTTENILTNILKKQKLGKQLTGMNILSESKHIFRPMLEISKTDIFKYAHIFKIPYFKNSTPSWSQRGKIRDSVIPALNAWDSGFSDSLNYLADYMSELDSVKDMYVENFLKDNYDENNMILTLGKTIPKSVWYDIIGHITRGAPQTISKASMDHFYNKLYGMQHEDKVVNRVNLNKNLYVTCLDKNKIGFHFEKN